jgi:hypothetical protein
MKSIKEFYQDKETRDNVYNYLISWLEKEAIRKTFEKENTLSIGEAKDIIDKAWEEMSLLFEPKVKAKEPVNQSR